MPFPFLHVPYDLLHVLCVWPPLHLRYRVTGDGARRPGAVAVEALAGMTAWLKGA